MEAVADGNGAWKAGEASAKSLGGVKVDLSGKEDWKAARAAVNDVFREANKIGNSGNEALGASVMAGFVGALSAVAVTVGVAFVGSQMGLSDTTMQVLTLGGSTLAMGGVVVEGMRMAIAGFKRQYEAGKGESLMRDIDAKLDAAEAKGSVSIELPSDGAAGGFAKRFKENLESRRAAMKKSEEPDVSPGQSKKQGNSL